MKKGICLCLVLSIALSFCSCSSQYNKRIEKLEAIPMEDRTQEDWENLVKYYKAAKRDMSELRHSYFSGSIQDEYNEDSGFPVYDLLKLPAPVPDVQEGTYDGPVTIEFTTENYSYGTLCIRVEWYDEGDKSFKVYDNKVVLPEARNYSVYAYIVENDSDDFCVSDEFYSFYRIENSQIQELSFGKESGTYKPPFSTSINPVSTGKIYYTIDGTDPLVNSEIKGILYEGGEISLPMGFNSVNARHVLDNGLVGPLATGDYNVVRQYAQNSNFVAEDNRFEYVVENGAVIATNKKTGETNEYKYENHDANSVYAYSEKKSDREIMGESRYSEVAIAGEIAVALNKVYWRDYLYINLTNRHYKKDNTSYVKYTFVDGKQKDKKSAEGTYKQTSQKKLPDLKTNGGFTQDFYSIHTDDLIVYSQYASTPEGRKIYVKKCNMDGTGEKLLWEEFEHSIGLNWITFDAIIGNYVFCEYYYGEVRASRNSYKVIREGYSEHYVYNLATGKKVENKLSKDGWEFHGALSEAVFMRKKTDDGKFEYKRIPYDQIASVFGI